MINIAQTKKKFLLTSLLALGCFTGCSYNPVHSTTKENADDQKVNPTLKKVDFQGDLTDIFIITKAVQGQVSENLLKAQVGIKNIGKKNIRFNYKWEWLDEQGFVIQDSSLVWVPGMARSGEEISLQNVSTTPKAINFKLKIQRANNP